MKRREPERIVSFNYSWLYMGEESRVSRATVKIFSDGFDCTVSDETLRREFPYALRDSNCALAEARRKLKRLQKQNDDLEYLRRTLGLPGPAD